MVVRATSIEKFRRDLRLASDIAMRNPDRMQYLQPHRFANSYTPARSVTSLDGRRRMTPLSSEDVDSQGVWSDLVSEEFLGFTERSHSKEDQSPFPFISSGAASTEDFIADLSFLVRTVAPLAHVVEETPAFQALGITTGENAFMGLLAAYKASKRFETACQLSDRTGQLESGLDVVRGGAQGIGGGGFLGYRALMTVSEIKGVDTSVAATTQLGQATFVIGMVGSSFFMLFYAMLGLLSGLNAYTIASFHNQLSTSDDKIDFLFKKVIANTEDKINRLQHSMSAPENLEEVKGKWKSAALDELTRQFYAWKKESKESEFSVSKDEIHSSLVAFLNKINNNPDLKKKWFDFYVKQLNLPEKISQDLDIDKWSAIDIYGFKVCEEQRQMRKDIKMGRVIGSENVEKIKKAFRNGLDQSVSQTADTEKTALIDSVKQSLKINLVMNTLLCMASILGVITSMVVMGVFVVPLGGTLLIALLTIGLIVMMGIVDGYSMKTGLEKGAPGKYDHLFVMGAALTLTAFLVSSVVITWAFSFPLTPLIVSLVAGGVSLGVFAYSYHQTRQHQKKWLEDHPDIAQVVAEASDAKVVQLYKKLPKNKRQSVRSDYAQRYDRYIGICEPQIKRYIDSLKDQGNWSFFDRATKRVSKQLWATWRQTGKEEDNLAAQAFEKLMDKTKGDSRALDIEKLAPNYRQELYRQIYALRIPELFVSDLKYSLSK